MCKERERLVLPGQGSCLYYVPIFPVGLSIREVEAGVGYTHMEEDYHIVFIPKGEMTISFDKYTDCQVRSGEMFYLHAMVEYRITTIIPTKIVEIRFNQVYFPCTNQARNRLLQKIPEMKYSRRGSIMKKEIQQWLNQMIHYKESGLSCSHLLDIKNKELYLLLKHYYTDEEKVQFFHFTSDMKSPFRELVLTHYLQVKTVQELAADLGYGIKTFRHVFKQHFGETPYKWMQEQTALRIKARLMDQTICLKQIMFEFKFDSSSHFYHYCRRQFGATPTQIRNMAPKSELQP